MLLSCTTEQALDVWHQLVLAHAEINPFGSDVAEIYISSLIPHSGWYARGEHADVNSIFYEDHQQILKEATQSLIAICQKFAQTNECEVQAHHPTKVVWAPVGVLAHTVVNHRVHIKVRKSGT